MQRAAYGRVEFGYTTLKAAAVPYHTYFRLGDVAQTLVAVADKLGCASVVTGTRGLGAMPGIVLGSVTRIVLHLAPLPVVCAKQ